MAERADVDDVGVAGIDDDAGGAADLVQPDVGPRAAGVDALVDTVTKRDVGAELLLVRFKSADEVFKKLAT